MAFSSTLQWDVRTSGNDGNGGAFDPSSSGTNYAMQDSPQVTYTDLVIGGTTTQCTSAGTPFTAAHVGNVINITSGTNFVVQRVQVISVSVGVATCDKSLGTAAATGGNGKLGGGLATIATANGLTVTSNTLNIKSGTYTQTVNLAIPATVNIITWAGYGTVWGDGGTAPLITTATNSVHLISTNNASDPIATFVNLSLSSTAGTPGHGVLQLTGSTSGTGGWIFANCIFSGFDIGIANDNGAGWFVGRIAIIGCEIKNCTTVGFRGFTAVNSIYGSWFHGNAVHIGGGAITGLTLSRSIFSASTAGSASVSMGSGGLSQCVVAECVFANNANDGIDLGFAGTATIISNIFYGNGAWGVRLPQKSNGYWFDYSAYGSNVSGNFTGTGSVAGPHDVALSANPFTSSTNFGLNSTAGGGAACKAVSFPGVFPGGSSTGSLDIGAVQTAGGGATGGLFTLSGMTGGMRG